ALVGDRAAIWQNAEIRVTSEGDRVRPGHPRYRIRPSDRRPPVVDVHVHAGISDLEPARIHLVPPLAAVVTGDPRGEAHGNLFGIRDGTGRVAVRPPDPRSESVRHRPRAQRNVGAEGDVTGGRDDGERIPDGRLGQRQRLLGREQFPRVDAYLADVFAEDVEARSGVDRPDGAQLVRVV